MAYPTGELSISLHAIVQNWRSIQKFLSVDTVCGAVVKANAYGLGVERIAPVLYGAGCRQFFVANLKEAIQLQSLVGRDVEIFVLSGCITGAEEEFILRKFIPVIVSIEMLGRWHSALKKQALFGRIRDVDLCYLRLVVTRPTLELLLFQAPVHQEKELRLGLI